MSDSPSSVGSGLTDETGTTSNTPSSKSSKRSRFSFGGSGRSFLRSTSDTSQGPKSPKSESFFRRSNGSPGSSELNGGEFSEVSVNSSASQSRPGLRRSLAKQFDRMSLSTLSVLQDQFSGGVQEDKVDRLDLKSRELEVILEGALGISEKLHVCFEKHKDALAGNERAVNLETQNDRIKTKTLDRQMFTTVAFYGDNGAGKSSLINALLDNECITPTLSNDNSCTATPIEFRMRDRGQKMVSAYTVIIDIISDEEWFPLAKRLLESLEKDSADAEFVSARAVLKLLFNLTEDIPVDLQMIGNIPLACKNLSKRFSPQSLLELRKYIEELNTLYWPVLKRITIYMDTPVLNTGVILVDLPGLGNMNFMKAAVINDYLKSSDKIFIVSDISQVRTGDLLSGLVFEPINLQTKLGTSFDLTFILTQIDNVTTRADTQDWNKRQSILERIETTRSWIMKPPESQLNSTDIFYVSSLEYQWNHKRLLDPRTVHCLSAEESGIPLVRRFIQQNGMQRRESVVKNLVQGNMITFMNSVQNWCSEEEDPVSPTIQEHTSQEYQTSCFEALQKSVHDTISVRILNQLSVTVAFFKDQISDKVIEEAAEEPHKIIENWISKRGNSWSSYSYAIRHKGTFQETITKNKVDWNQDIANALINRVIEPWGMTFSALPISDIFKDVTRALFEMISEAIKSITSDANVYHELDSIKLRVIDILSTQERLLYQNLQNIAGVLNYTYDKTIIPRKMEPLYEKLKTISGTGAVATGKYIIRTQVTAISLSYYREVREISFGSLDQLITNLERDLITELNEILTDIKLNYFRQPEKKVEIVDLTNVKAEILVLSKFMKQLEYRANQPRTTEYLVKD